MTNYERELYFYLQDLIEQVEQFPEIAKGINMSHAKGALCKAHDRREEVQS